MTVLHRIGDRYYNLATVAKITVEPASSRAPRDKPGPCVEIISSIGHVRYVTGHQAEALTDYLNSDHPFDSIREREFVCLTVVEVAPPELAKTSP